MKQRKRAVTLIEIMIVILLIGIIGGALAFNMRGSLDKGKVFKTQTTQARVYDILMLKASEEDLTMEEVAENWVSHVKTSPLVKKGTDLTRDGWNQKISVRVVDEEIDVYSPGLANYKKKHESK